MPKKKEMNEVTIPDAEKKTRKLVPDGYKRITIAISDASAEKLQRTADGRVIRAWAARLLTKAIMQEAEPDIYEIPPKSVQPDLPIS